MPNILWQVSCFDLYIMDLRAVLMIHLLFCSCMGLLLQVLPDEHENKFCITWS
jgi:hypothetical protein